MRDFTHEKVTETGHYDMPIDVYHGDCCAGPSLSATSIKQLLADPSEFWRTSSLNPDYEAPESKKAFNVGTAAHTMILEPELLESTISVVPSEILASNGALSTKAAKQFVEDQTAMGRTVVKPDEWDLPYLRAPDPVRDSLDYDPTPPDATRALLAVEGARLREIGGPVWEPAVGGGHMARELQAQGFEVIGSDIVDRGWMGTQVAPFYEWSAAPALILITNPPYNEINARDEHGRWLKHIEALGVRYAAMLLNWDWIAARINGMDALHERFPVSRAYMCCWKIDFRGGGSPPQRNGWLVWDLDWRGETVLRRLYREAGGPIQETLL